jgi:hypothetical protein
MNLLFLLASLLVAMLILLGFYLRFKVHSRKIIITTSIMTVGYVCVSFFYYYVVASISIVGIIGSLLLIPVAPFILFFETLSLLFTRSDSIALMYEPTIYEFLFHTGIYTISISMLSWLVDKAFQQSKSIGIALLIGVCVVGVTAFFTFAMISMGGM